MGGRITKISRDIASMAPGGKPAAGAADDEVLTLAEAADFTKVSERTMWKLASEDKVPHRRVGAQYRFLRSQLITWMMGDE